MSSLFLLLPELPWVQWPCPTWGKELACLDHSKERAWRHLDTCQFRTFLHARIPRVECPEHGVVPASVPWAGIEVDLFGNILMGITG